MRLVMRLLLCVLLPFVHGALAAGPLEPEEVPEPLQPWVGWVLHGEEERLCPFLYTTADSRRCAWPSRLTLDLTDAGGRFEQQWEVYAASWVVLPGEARHWPQQVKVDGAPARVTFSEDQPRVRLAAGTHRVEGEFLWDRLPESLRIAEDSGLIALTVGGSRVEAPDVDEGGQLWLRERDSPRPDREAAGETLSAQVHRKVVDTIPLQVITRIDLDVSGSQREVVLGPALLAEHIPLRLGSPLPARLEPDGRLRIQVRPGRWTIELVSRHPGETTEIPLAAAPSPWPEEEFWVFEARRHLRLVEVAGVTPVDPRQTNLPADWRSLPAYRVGRGETMRLEVVRRGDPEPEPDKLGLARQLWLDFGGDGYTIQDTLTGTMTRGWRLEASPALELGQVTIGGQPQFITTLPGSDRQGVEVRRGSLQLVADSRYGGPIGDLRAVGWDQDMQSLRLHLNLPPGWRLFSASGMDNVPDTWLQRWTLLDLFLVLIASVAVYRLWGWRWGLIALVTLALVWHEQAGIGPPRYVWLNLLAAVALLRVLPQGRIRQAVTWYRNLALLVLVLIAIPFMVGEIRLAIYPQLERHASIRPQPVVADRVGGIALEEAPSSAPAEPATRQESYAPLSKGQSLSQYLSESRQLTQIDPNARVQTGPGLPSWRWRQVDLLWNGPVDRGQRAGLVFLSPGHNLVLGFLRVGLLAALALLMMGFNYAPGRGVYRQAGLLGALLLLPMVMAVPQPAAADIPDPALLDELKTRLLQAPDCMPACAQSSRLRLEIDRETLHLRVEVHAEAAVAVPLPANSLHWLPEAVLIDGEPAPALFRARDGGLWTRVDEGTHQISLAGPSPDRSRFQLPLTLRPHRVDIQSEGWIVEGVHEDDVPDAQLQLTRVKADGQVPAIRALEPSAMPTFTRVERTLRLNLDWTAETHVIRLSPAANAAIVEVPLLPGESVLTEGVRTVDGKVLVNMPPGEREAFWVSTLEKQSSLTLAAAETASWHEVWRVDVSPMWHLETDGIAVAHHKDRTGNWLPEWWPWPGEKVRLAVTRPEGVEGQTLTIDASTLTVQPGKRATDATLTLTARSSQGGQHTLLLPEGADLQSVTIDGTAQPVRQDGRTVTLPLVPGKQTLALSWRTGQGIEPLYRTPQLDLGARSVNTMIELELGRNRWTLLAGGPRLGPAVLFWSTLLVIVLVAVGLSRVPFTPLRMHHWLLLGIGLSQVPVAMAAVAVGWLLALGLRGRSEPKLRPVSFDLMQIGLALLTLLALGFLFAAIKQGLLGLPEMQISGNGSSAYNLRWYQDRSVEQLPQAWVASVPLLVYRLLMLAWALWLAFALLRWLRWGWTSFSSHGIWRPLNLRKSRKRGPPRENEKESPQSPATG